MGEEDKNQLLKSISDNVKSFTDAVKGLKGKEDVDVSSLEKTADSLTTQLGEFEDQGELIKTLESEKATLESEKAELQKTVDAINEAAVKAEHDTLVKTALDLVKDIDPKTEVKDEDALIKSISENFSEDEMKDVDTCIKADIKAMELAKKHIPEGSLPGQDDGNNLDDELSKDAQEAAELRKLGASLGIVKGDE